jgi:MFS transporter, AAHS family, 4-hydroxybenzoate transporter
MQPLVDVSSVIDDSKISSFQVRIFSVCLLIMMFDGFDIQVIAFVTPSIATEWNLPIGSFGLIFAATLLGSMVGAFLLGYLADKVGRRGTLAFCLMAFGAINFASAFAPSLQIFMILRFLCGIGLGGAIPNVIALVSEYAPAKLRARIIALTWCGFALGGVLGGVISIPLIANFGWPSVFIIGGILPLCLGPLVYFALPESIKFLILARQSRDVIASILMKINPQRDFNGSADYVLNETKTARGHVLALFRDGLGIGSVFLCLALFMSLLLVYCLINWIPLLLHDAGLPLKQAVLGSIVFNLAGILGSFLCTWLIDREGSRPIAILIWAYFFGAMSVACIGFAGISFWPLMASIFMSGFLLIGVQLSLQAFIANYYPTAIRGTGIGWSQVVGRSGSLLGPLVGGVLVTGGMSPTQLFQISSGAPLLACLSLLLFAKFSSARPKRSIKDLNAAIPVIRDN